MAVPDVAVNLESVLRRVMPLDWQEQGTVFAWAVVIATRGGRSASVVGGAAAAKVKVLTSELRVEVV